MKDRLYTIPVKVTTLSPLHIGSGDNVYSFETTTSNGMTDYVNENKLMDWVSQDERRANQFVAEMQKKRPNIWQFLRNNHQTLSNFVRYAIPSRVEEARNPRPFIKDAALNPYIPGSSLKGGLRSALLRAALLSNAELRQRLSNELLPLVARADKDANEQLQKEALAGAIADIKDRSYYDLGRALIVTDSRPLKCSDQELNEIRVLSVQTDEKLRFKQNQKHSKDMTIHAETIKSGKTFDVLLRRDMALLSGSDGSEILGLSHSDLRSLLVHLAAYCRLAGHEILRQEARFYRYHQHKLLKDWYENRIEELKKEKESTFYIPISWGSGFDAKTATDLLGFDILEALSQQFRNTKGDFKFTKGWGRPENDSSHDWLDTLDSPKSRHVVCYSDHEIYPLGWVKVQLLDSADAPPEWQALKTDSITPPENTESIFHEIDCERKTDWIDADSQEKIPLAAGTTFVGVMSDYLPDDGTFCIRLPGYDEGEALGLVESQDNLPKIEFNNGVSVDCEIKSIRELPNPPGFKDVFCIIHRRHSSSAKRHGR